MIARMASSATLHFLLVSLFCSFLLTSSSDSSQQSQTVSSSKSKPNLLVLPLQRDATTGLHWTNLHKRTPLTQIPVLVDLNGNHLWVNCEQHYNSKTYQAPFCHSTQCTRANTQLCHTCTASASRPGCHNNTCGLVSANPVTQQTAMGELAQDVLAIQYFTRSRSRLSSMAQVPHFLFSCAPSFLMQKGLPNNVQGVAGLGHAPISLPNQLAAYFGLQRQFTLCLSRSPASNGAILFGDAATNIRGREQQNLFRGLSYTPLTITQKGEYHVHVSSIRVNQNSVVPVPSSVLSSVSSSPHGVVLGGTMISTTIPYTILHHSIYEALTQVFSKQVPNQMQVKAVAPFGMCFDSKKMQQHGVAPPSVDFVMDRDDVVWRISGESLMVQAKPGVSCLGFVNGGLHPRAAIAIGGRQLEENLVVFDLARSRLGFSTSLYSHGMKCSDLSNYNNAP